MPQRAISGTRAKTRNRRRIADRLSSQHAVSTEGSRTSNLARIEELDIQFDEFVAYVGGYLRQSPMSLLWYRRSFASYRQHLLEGIDLSGPAFAGRIHDIEGWVTALNARIRNGRRVSPITVNSYWRGLRRFYVDVERRGGVNPFRGVKAPAFNAAVPKAKSADDCRRILETAYHYPWPDPHVEYKRALARAVIAVMLLAGLRRSEVVHLQNGDVDLPSGTILVAHGKGIAGGRARKAYVSPELRTILTAYDRERKRHPRYQERPEYFISPKTSVGLSLEGLRKIVEKISRASGVEFSAHVLRHSFVTHLLRSDVPLHIVRDLAGHRNIATTLGYLRVFDDDLFANIRKMRFR